MIHLDFALAISLFLFSGLLLVIGHIIFYNYNRLRKEDKPPDVFMQCPYCAYLFTDKNEGGPVNLCPRCKSYLTVK